MLAPNVTSALKEALGPDAVFEREPMSAHTTFKIGGPADVLVLPSSVAQVQAVVRICRETAAKLWVIGCGSDLLVADAGLAGVVMECGERLARITVEGTRLTAQAGATKAAVSEAACAHGLSGYEFACGIPGTVGGRHHERGCLRGAPSPMWRASLPASRATATSCTCPTTRPIGATATA